MAARMNPNLSNELTPVHFNQDNTRCTALLWLKSGSEPKAVIALLASLEGVGKVQLITASPAVISLNYCARQIKVAQIVQIAAASDAYIRQVGC